MAPRKTNTEQSRSTKWEKGDYTVPKMCDMWALHWEEEGQMRQLDMSHGNVQIMTGTAGQLMRVCHGRPALHFPL